MNSKILIIEGIIGAGKTYLANWIQKNVIGATVFKESIDPAMLTTYYSDMKTFGSTAQNMCLEETLSRMRNVVNTFKKEKEFMKCAPWSIVVDCGFDRSAVFGVTLHQLGYMCDTSFQKHMSMLESVQEKLMSEVNHEDVRILWLDTDPEECLKRIKIRGNPYEQNIDLDYLKQLRENYKRRLGLKPNVLRITNEPRTEFIMRLNELTVNSEKMFVYNEGTGLYDSFDTEEPDTGKIIDNEKIPVAIKLSPKRLTFFKRYCWGDDDNVSRIRLFHFEVDPTAHLLKYAGSIWHRSQKEKEPPANIIEMLTITTMRRFEKKPVRLYFIVDVPNEEDFAVLCMEGIESRFCWKYGVKGTRFGTNQIIHRQIVTFPFCDISELSVAQRVSL